MPTIANAPSGENTAPTGTEKIPVSGSQYIQIDTLIGFALESAVVYEGDVVTYDGEISWQT